MFQHFVSNVKLSGTSSLKQGQILIQYVQSQLIFLFICFTLEITLLSRPPAVQLQYLLSRTEILISGQRRLYLTVNFIPFLKENSP